jgi:threonine aldolase
VSEAQYSDLTLQRSRHPKEEQVRFGSDNESGASTRVLEALMVANQGASQAYGNDDWTAEANKRLAEVFQCEVDAFFVASGTAANALALSCVVSPWQTILCHEQAHIAVDESTAIEFFTAGSRIVQLPGDGGRLTADRLEQALSAAPKEAPHNAQPGAVSIAQCNERGLAYSPDELAAIAAVAHEHGLSVHMDGARFANAIAALQCQPAEITWKAGIDVLSMGGTKNGCLVAEAVVFFDRSLGATISHRVKRSGHLLSKSRFLGAQFVAWLSDGHWLDLAEHANRQARELSQTLAGVPGVQVVWPTEANEVFAVMPARIASRLRAAGADFYDWYVDALPDGFVMREHEVFVRLVTSHATTTADTTRFCELVRGCVSRTS